MSSRTIDYDALAKQYGAVQSAAPSVDYDALAKQHGAVTSTSTQTAPKPSFWSNPRDFLAQRSQELAQAAQEEKYKALGPESQGRSYMNRMGHALLSVVPETASLADKFASGLFDWKTAPVIAAGAVDPAIPAAYFMTQGAQGTVEAGKDIRKNGLNPENAQNALTSLSMVAGGPAAAKAPTSGTAVDVVKAGVQKTGAAGQALAERMYQSSLKPSVASYSTKEVKQMVRTGLDNAIPVSPKGAAKLDSLVNDLRNQVNNRIQNGSSEGATVNKFDVTRRLNDTVDRFSNQVSPTEDLATISNVGNDFLATKPSAMTAAEAQKIKSGTYQQIKSRGYGEVKSAQVEAEKALARGIKEELEVQFPEIKGLNAQEGKLIQLDEALERAVRRTENRDMLSLGGKVVTAGAGAALGGELGAMGAVGGSMATLVLHHVFTDPAIQSKMAIALSKASKIAMPEARARVANYARSLETAIPTAPATSENQPSAPSTAGATFAPEQAMAAAATAEGKTVTPLKSLSHPEALKDLHNTYGISESFVADQVNGSGVKFNGIWDASASANGLQVQLTDPKTGSTFSLPLTKVLDPETLTAELEARRQGFRDVAEQKGQQGFDFSGKPSDVLKRKPTK